MVVAAAAGRPAVDAVRESRGPGNLAVYKGLPDNVPVFVDSRSSSDATLEAASSSQREVIWVRLNNRWGTSRATTALYGTSQKTTAPAPPRPTTGGRRPEVRTHFPFYETLYRGRKHTYTSVGALSTTTTPTCVGRRLASGRCGRPRRTSPTRSSTGSTRLADVGRLQPERRSSTAATGSINPSRGLYASFFYRAFFEGFLGGASDWQQLSYDARTYLRLTRDARHKLSFWFSGDFVTSGVAPYLDLPATGWTPYGRAGRGYPQGRFRGQDLVYGEAEYRWTVTKNGLFGVVAFLNTETFSNEQTGEELFDSFASGAGLGLRVMLNKRSQTNLCFDVGWASRARTPCTSPSRRPSERGGVSCLEAGATGGRRGHSIASGRDSVRDGLVVLGILVMALAGLSHGLTLRRLRAGEPLELAKWPLALVLAFLLSVLFLADSGAPNAIRNPPRRAVRLASASAQRLLVSPNGQTHGARGMTRTTSSACWRRSLLVAVCASAALGVARRLTIPGSPGPRGNCTSG